MESLLRAMSTQMKKVLRVFTGVYGIIAKRDKKGNMTDLYLHSSDDNRTNGIEVPLIIWKLVIDVKTKESVAFFTSNETDMDKKQVELFSTLCHSVCDEFGYRFNSEPSSGITLCCEYQDFIQHIRYLPVKLNTSKLLKNTSSFGKPNRKGSKEK